MPEVTIQAREQLKNTFLGLFDDVAAQATVMRLLGAENQQANLR